MKTITWKPLITLPLRGPGASEIYRWDWADWVDGETLVNPPVIEADPGISATLYYLGADYVDLRIQGVTTGQTCAVTVTVTSAISARVGVRTVRFVAAEQ